MIDVGIHLPTPNRPTSAEEETVLHHVMAGLEAHGLRCEFSAPHEQKQPYPVAVMFGWGKLRHQEILRVQRAVDAPTLVVNFGSLKRDFGYYSLGWNGLNGRADYCNQFSPRDRWAKLGIDLKPWKTDGSHVLVIGQVPTDGSVAAVDIISWCEHQAIKLSSITQRKILFRPHPLARAITPDIRAAQRSERPLVDDLKDAWAVVTYNSTSGSMSVIEGVPVFASDPGSMAWDVANHNLDLIDSPIRFDRGQWAYNLAYTQWNLQEIKSGFSWDHLKKKVLR